MLTYTVCKCYHGVPTYRVKHAYYAFGALKPHLRSLKQNSKAQLLPKYRYAAPAAEAAVRAGSLAHGKPAPLGSGRYLRVSLGGAGSAAGTPRPPPPRPRSPGPGRAPSPRRERP